MAAAARGRGSIITVGRQGDVMRKYGVSRSPLKDAAVVTEESGGGKKRLRWKTVVVVSVKQDEDRGHTFFLFLTNS
ncbi:hypothetical protein A2U01_0027409 [Trifolium medium]|uniref:Uncharacterized protein n=1 Tax=Trifolium medium TaxID=97028 RepID=A0A392P4J2_9FABA|nr:hypothetical protein [Trifolium medium]